VNAVKYFSASTMEEWDGRRVQSQCLPRGPVGALNLHVAVDDEGRRREGVEDFFAQSGQGVLTGRHRRDERSLTGLRMSRYQ
jgi:hypothetical protein